jgi:2-amino-4-hydroxy-6-hydroxymethyldihydropteridine diphosphokinase
VILNKNNHINIVTFDTENLVEEGIIAYIGLGTNLGDRLGNIQTALQKLADLPTIKLMRVSSLYETAPVGVTEQPDFLNVVAAARTSLAPQALLDALLHIENQMGRVRTERWGPRVIDMDLLLYGADQVALPGLTVPHPRLRERAFVVIPLAEIAPDLALPGDGKKATDLAELFLEHSSRKGNIRRVGFV